MMIWPASASGWRKYGFGLLTQIMPIKVIKVRNRHCPAAVCDGCGKPITDAENGNVLWLLTGKVGGKSVLRDELFLTHKKCNRAFERKLTYGKEAEVHVLSEGLDVFIARLVTNLGITLESAKRTKSRMDLLDSIVE